MFGGHNMATPQQGRAAMSVLCSQLITRHRLCFHIVSGTAPPYLSEVQLLHTSLNCFISTFLLALFAQPQILGHSVFLGWTGEPWGRDPFNTSDLSSGTLFLSLSGIRLHSLLFSKIWKATSTFCILICRILSFHYTNPSPVMHVFVISVCVCARARVPCVRACVCVCARMCVCVLKKPVLMSL